ncbi:MAG: PQQ-binding-like beta-propeller repeat protein, partial [Chloroflexota bacterium]
MDKSRKKRGPVLKFTGGAIFLYLLLFGCMNVFFAWPWNGLVPIGGDELNTLHPTHNGVSALFFVEDASGQPIGWESHNYRTMPLANTLINMSETEQSVLSRLYGSDILTDQVTTQMADEGIRFIEVTQRRINQNYEVVNESVSLIVRNNEGDFWLSENAKEDNPLIWLDPLPLFSANINTPPTLSQPIESSQGLTAVSLTLTPLNQLQLYETTLPDCYQQAIQFDTVSKQETVRTFCDNVGLAKIELFENGSVVEKSTLISSSQTGVINHILISGTSGAMAPPIPSNPQVNTVTASELTVVGSFRERIGSSEASIPLTLLPTTPNLLLGAQVNGRLTAMNPNSGEVAWAFATENSIFGQPRLDLDHARIYFGSSDKHLYAIDFNGLFLWRFKTNDNVVTAPIIFGETLFFGSEDGNIYCLNRHTGTLQSSFSTNGALTAQPAIVQDIIVFGSDDGGVYGIDPNHCEPRWIYDAGDAVEAGILAYQNDLIIVGRSLLTSLNSETGEANWSIETQETHRSQP